MHQLGTESTNHLDFLMIGVKMRMISDVDFGLCCLGVLEPRTRTDSLKEPFESPQEPNKNNYDNNHDESFAEVARDWIAV